MIGEIIEIENEKEREVASNNMFECVVLLAVTQRLQIHALQLCNIF